MYKNKLINYFYKYYKILLVIRRINI